MFLKYEYAGGSPLFLRIIFLAHWAEGSQGELIVYQSSRRLDVCVDVSPHFQT